MSRRSIAVCAGILVSGAIIGCSSESPRPVAPASGQATAWVVRQTDAPQIVELHGETPVPPAAPLDRETHPPASLEMAPAQQAEICAAVEGQPVAEHHSDESDSDGAAAEDDTPMLAFEPSPKPDPVSSATDEGAVKLGVESPRGESHEEADSAANSTERRHDSRLKSAIITASPRGGSKKPGASTTSKTGTPGWTKAGKKLLEVQATPDRSATAGDRVATRHPTSAAENAKTSKGGSLKIDVGEEPVSNRVAIKGDSSDESSTDAADAEAAKPASPTVRRPLASISIAPAANAPVPEDSNADTESSEAPVDSVAKEDAPKLEPTPALTLTPEKPKEPTLVEVSADDEPKAKEPTLAIPPAAPPQLAAPTPAVPKTSPPERSTARQDEPKREMTPVEIAPLATPKSATPPKQAPQVIARNEPPKEPPKSEPAPAEMAPREVPRAEVARPAPKKPLVPDRQVVSDDLNRRMPSVTIAPRPIVESDAPLQNQISQKGRSPEMIAAISQADQRVLHGFELAQRGALYLAKAEFTAALKLLSQARDVEQGSRSASKSVTAALVAIRESSDFVRQSAGPEDVDLAKIVAGHKTPVLKDVDTSDMPPPVAAERYQLFAEQQLATALGHEMVASMALYGLGKSVIVGAGSNARQPEYTGPASAFYQASLAVEPRNFRSANELGVLLANNGQLRLAKELLTRSAKLAPNPATWQNLAVVHGRMGDTKTAEQLQAEAAEMRKNGPSPGGLNVQWVDPATFASAAPPNDATLPTSPGHTPAAKTTQSGPMVTPVVEPAKPPSNVAKRFNDWLPPNLRR